MGFRKHGVGFSRLTDLTDLSDLTDNYEKRVRPVCLVRFSANRGSRIQISGTGGRAWRMTSTGASTPVQIWKERAP